jgi:hypothetical protein
MDDLLYLNSSARVSVIQHLGELEEDPKEIEIT